MPEINASSDPIWIHEICHYNPDCDLVAVSSVDVVSLADAFVNGILPENVVIPDTEYDGNDNPESIIGRPANQFDAIHMRETLEQLSSSAKTKDASSLDKTKDV